MRILTKLSTFAFLPFSILIIVIRSTPDKADSLSNDSLSSVRAALIVLPKVICIDSWFIAFYHQIPAVMFSEVGSPELIRETGIFI
jgi:hypothetical protein